MFHSAPPDILYFISSSSVTSCSSWCLTFDPLVSAGWCPAIGHGQRRVQPSESAAGRVRRPPASPQSPFQGRPAERVERPGPSPSGHHSAAEGPNHIKPLPLPPLPRSFRKKSPNFLRKNSHLKSNPASSHHEEKRSSRSLSESGDGKWSPSSPPPPPPALCQEESDSVDALSSPPVFPRSRAVLSVWVVLPLNGISSETQSPPPPCILNPSVSGCCVTPWRAELTSVNIV